MIQISIVEEILAGTSAMCPETHTRNTRTKAAIIATSARITGRVPRRVGNLTNAPMTNQIAVNTTTNGTIVGIKQSES